jgi:murein DD-endopeptidase MepM/ murein hydrolase activator NlpD
MSDEELITAVREQRTTVHMNIPVEQIIGRGRAVRSRRRIPGIAGALAVAAAAAFAVTALLPAGHQAVRPPSAQLAAWTVTKHSDGTVYVTFRELRDPAGLQSKLRADGVPASVAFFAQTPRSCQLYPAGKALINTIFQIDQGNSRLRRSTRLVIHPAALPGGTGVRISAPTQTPVISVGVGLVQASQRCTGS